MYSGSNMATEITSFDELEIKVIFFGRRHESSAQLVDTVDGLLFTLKKGFLLTFGVHLY